MSIVAQNRHVIWISYQCCRANEKPAGTNRIVLKPSQRVSAASGKVLCKWQNLINTI